MPACPWILHFLYGKRLFPSTWSLFTLHEKGCTLWYHCEKLLTLFYTEKYTPCILQSIEDNRVRNQLERTIMALFLLLMCIHPKIYTPHELEWKLVFSGTKGLLDGSRVVLPCFDSAKKWCITKDTETIVHSVFLTKSTDHCSHHGSPCFLVLHDFYFEVWKGWIKNWSMQWHVLILPHSSGSWKLHRALYREHFGKKMASFLGRRVPFWWWLEKLAGDDNKTHVATQLKSAKNGPYTFFKLQ